MRFALSTATALSTLALGLAACGGDSEADTATAPPATTAPAAAPTTPAETTGPAIPADAEKKTPSKDSSKDSAKDAQTAADKAEIKALAEKVVAAFNVKDWDTVCQAMAPESRDLWIKQAAEGLQEQGKAPKDCPAAWTGVYAFVEKFQEQAKAAGQAIPEDPLKMTLKVRKIRIKGDAATATNALSTGGAPAEDGYFKRVGGVWYMDLAPGANQVADSAAG